MNQLDMFSQRMGSRHIGCKEPLNRSQLEQLMQACAASGIAHRLTSTDKDKDIIYWVDSPITEGSNDLRIVQMDWVCRLLDWWWFIYLPWNEFLALAQGVHEFKDQSYYDKLLADYDKPFIEKDDRNREIQMNTLLEAGHYACIQ
jgi:hypothetical protein